jgi:hypothetical protein
MPDIMNLVVGDTHSIQALGSNGQSVTGLTWASTNTSVVSLSTDDPPILTAVAAGNATITAGTASANVTVSVALTSGTLLWSNPGDGSGVAKFVPAVPSATGVADLFALQNDGTVQAITSDGLTAWSANVAQPGSTLVVANSPPAGGPYTLVLPDFQGGLAVFNDNANNASIVKLDGITGLPYPAYAPGSTTTILSFAVNTDGTIFALQENVTNGTAVTSIVGIAPTTGTQIFSVPLVNAGTILDTLIVAGDGYAYVVYDTATPVPNGGGNILQFMLLRVNSAGASDYIPIRQFQPPVPSYAPAGPFVGPAPTFITNADTGILLSWYDPEDGYSMAITSGTTVTLISPPVVPEEVSPLLPMPGPFGPFANWGIVPILQSEDGSFVGTVPVGDPYNPQINMISFDQTGNVRWMVPNDQPQIATAGGGVIGQSGITYDQNGNATGRSSLSATVSPGWFGNILGTAYSAQSGAVVLSAASSVHYAPTFAAFQGGNASSNGTAIQQVMSNHPQTGVKQLPNLSALPVCYPLPNQIPAVPPTCGNINAIELLTSATPDSIFQNLIQTFAPVTIPPGQTKSPSSIQTFTDAGGSNAISVTGPGQVINIRVSNWWGGFGLNQNPFQVMSERVDPVNHVIAVVTLAGHPLAGWRYWRVYSIGTNDVVIETGAYDQPGPGRANYAGYFLGPVVIRNAWRQYVQYFQDQLHALQGTHLTNSLGPPPAPPIPLRSAPLYAVIPFNGPLVSGYWDYFGDFTSYILNNVCQSTVCN